MARRIDEPSARQLVLNYEQDDGYDHTEILSFQYDALLEAYEIVTTWGIYSIDVRTGELS